MADVRVKRSYHNRPAIGQLAGELEAFAVVYQTASDNLASVNQSRWSLVTSSLVANSFLVAAWVTI